MEEYREDWLDERSEQELKALKLWLFSENVRIETEKRNLLELQNRFVKERLQFQEEMKTLNLKITSSRQRLHQDEQFFDKKMEILKSGFAQLDEDRRAFEREKEAFHKLRLESETDFMESFDQEKSILFQGVKDRLTLKKRYRDLMKIFHPDNLSGHDGIVKSIQEEYGRLRRFYE